VKVRGTLAVAALCALVAAAAAAVFLRGKPAAPAVRFRTAAPPGESFSLMPEAERTFARVVVGLRPHGAARGRAARGLTDAREVDLRRRLFALDFELLHGSAVTAAPSYAVFYVAVPDPATVPEASGEEQADFLAYLADRLGWSAETIRTRVRFFRVAKPLPYPQDMAEILGLDSSGRLVLGVGADTDPVYAEPVERLASEFPRDFTVHRLAGLRVGDVNTEGGDLALSWLPEGRVGLLVGRHRALRYLKRRTGEDFRGRPLAEGQIEEVRSAYSAAFFGVETVIVGEAALRDPARGTDELFHADMVVAAVRNDREALAFVPTYEAAPRDAVSGQLLPEAFVRDVQREYDLVAGQMGDRGYRVVRVPFADHPVRSPVNVSKFVDVESGKPFVFLGRYPEHRPTSRAPSAAKRLDDAVLGLQAFVDAWEQAPREGARWDALMIALANAWEEIDSAAKSPNPVFDRQRALYEANGVGVRPLTQFPSGEGGIHCLLLR
jgi:hypothetical protein